MSPQKVVFCFEVPNIGQRIESNKFSTNVCIWDVPWKIHVWKVVTETSESLGVELLCLNESSEDWSYATTVTYRLCSFDGDVQAFEYKIHPKVINKTDNSIATNAFIEWSDLIDKEKVYVENDTIKIEFVIEVANLNLRDKSVLQLAEIPSHCCKKFDLSIKNTNNLMAVQSPHFDILNEQYYLIVYKYEGHLDVELCQMKDMESSSRPMMLVKLISDKGDDRSVVQYSQFLTEKLISWKELRRTENGFLYDNVIKLEVTIMADCVFQEATEFIQPILSSRNVASTTTLSFGNSADTTATLTAASSTLNKDLPFSQSQAITSANGRKITKFQPLAGRETLTRFGRTYDVQTRWYCIAAMKEYEGKCLEELRLEDLTSNQKRLERVSAQSGLFESKPQGKSMFGGPTTALFGAQSSNALDRFGAPPTDLCGAQSANTFGAATIPVNGSVTSGTAATSSAPVPTCALNSTVQANELVTLKGPSIASPKISFSKNQFKAEQRSSTNDVLLIFENLAKCPRSEIFLLSIKNASALTVVKSPKFLIQGKEYELVVRKLQNYLEIELKALYCDLRTQPIMLVTLVSNKGTDRSIMQYTRFRTEKLISWNELQNPENGFNYDHLINIEVTIVKSSIDLDQTQNILKVKFSSSINLSVRRFCIEVPQISNLDSIFSPDFRIYGVSWKVRVCKKVINAKPSLAVYLLCNKDNIANRSCAVSYTVKLISFSDNVRAVEHHFRPNVFSRFGNRHGGQIIDWNDLFDATKRYVKNDKIILDVKINFEDPKTATQAAIIFNDIPSNFKDQKKLKVTIENVDSLVVVQSPKFRIRNFVQNFQVYKHQDHLGVVLFPVEEERQTMVVELLSSRGEKRSVIHVQDAKYKKIRTMVTTWSELFKPENGFVKNNSITLEVTISANFSYDNELLPSTISSVIHIDCPICLENMKIEGASSIPCGHLYCTQCITNVHRNSSRCPLCRKPFNSTDIRRVILP